MSRERRSANFPQRLLSVVLPIAAVSTIIGAASFGNADTPPPAAEHVSGAATGPAKPVSAPTNPHTGLQEIPWQELEHAATVHDLGLAARRAARMGVATLAHALEVFVPNALPPSRDQDDKRARAAAVLFSVPVIDGAERLLPGIVQLLSSRDAEIAEAAVRATQEILEDVTPESFSLWEVPDAILPAICDRLAVISRDRQRPADLRVLAIAAASTALAAAGISSTDKEEAAGCAKIAPALRSDRIAEVRRAAILCAEPVDPKMLTTELEDPDLRTGLAAAVRLCERQDKQEHDFSGGFLHAAERFVSASNASAADIVPLLDCLARDTKPETRRILELATSSTNKTIRRRASELLAGK